MDQQTVWQQYRSLPHEVQQQVVDFLSFLHQTYGSSPDKNTPLPDVTEEPFVGMWQDRSAMHDSSGWVRNLRTDAWRDHKKQDDSRRHRIATGGAYAR